MTMTNAQLAHFNSRDICARHRAAHRLIAVHAYEAFRMVGHSRSSSLIRAAIATKTKVGSLQRWLHQVRGTFPRDNGMRLFLLLDRQAKAERIVAGRIAA